MGINYMTMMKKALLTLAFLFCLNSVLLGVATENRVFAAESNSNSAAKAEVCDGLGLTPDKVTGNCEEKGVTISSVLKVVLNILSAIAAIAAIIMIMISGLRYITSGGDSAGVQGAKNTILYAIVGLVIVVIAQAIVQFTLNRTAAPKKQEASHILLKYRA